MSALNPKWLRIGPCDTYDTYDTDGMASVPSAVERVLALLANAAVVVVGVDGLGVTGFVVDRVAVVGVGRFSGSELWRKSRWGGTVGSTFFR